tara:strand:- start:301 stop:2169 length:1869 start_codon:yes stop_codon:yes gene_type:complete
MENIAPEMDKAGFWSAEVWGGATFDVTTRFLGEDPWERLRVLKKLMPKTPLQMLLRGQNLVGYRNYADDVVREFVKHSSDEGMDVYRVFDAVNDERNFETAAEAIKDNKKHFQATICYSVTGSHMGGDVFNLEYFVNKAKIFQDMGADSLCVKDMAGILAPYDAFELIKALKENIDLPIQLHTHYTSGMASMTVLKAIEAGLDMVDTCLSPYAMRTSQPAIEPLLVTLQNSERATGLDLEHLLKLSEYFEEIAPLISSHFDTSKASIVDPAVLNHQIPGGMASNLISQLKEADALDRLGEVYKELPMLRKELGTPPLVTPTSQIVGTQAVLNVLFGRYEMVSSQVKDLVYGLYGKTPKPIDPEVTKKVLKGYERGEQPVTGRAADFLEPELEDAKKATEGLAKDIGDVLTYALYPVTGLRFLKWKYGEEPIPDDVKAKTLEEVKAEIEAEKDLLAKIKSGDIPPAPVFTNNAGGRTFNVQVGQEIYQVQVEELSDGSNTITSAPRPIATAPVAQSGPKPISTTPAAQSGPKPISTPATQPTATVEETQGNQGATPIPAPMPGIVLRYAVEVGQKVSKGDTVLFIEAMKMENALSSPVDGVVKELNISPGTWVKKDDTLAVIG